MNDLSFRQYLAVLHHNENANQKQATTSPGQPMYRTELPKAKKKLHCMASKNKTNIQ